MATPANAGRKSAPHALRILGGRETKHGEPIDSAGRPIIKPPSFGRGAPKRPKHIEGDAAWLWDRVVEQMDGIGILKPLDGPSLEVMCETFARWREATRQRYQNGLVHTTSQGQSAAPWIGIEERAGREFRAWCSEYGITPAAERNLTNGETSNVPDGDNPY